MKTITGYKAAIFDMDGLMFDTEPLYNLSWFQAAEELGYHLSTDFFEQAQGRNNTDAESILLSHTSPEFDLASFRQSWKKKWFEIGRKKGIKKKEGLLDLLNHLKSAKILLGLATSSNAEIMDFCLHESGLRNVFNTTVCGQDVERGKPEPDIYLKAAENLQIQPEKCIVFEDSTSGAMAGINAGMKVILIPDQIEPKEEAKQRAVYFGKSLIEAIPLLSL